MTKARIIVSIAAAAGAMLITQPALAGAHTWRFTEVFSNASGSVQFIEIHCSSGSSEVFLSGLQITSQSTGHSFTFPSNLVAPTTDKYILLATTGFAALAGAPTPDYTIPAGFFSVNGDTLRYHVYDTWVITAAQVPIDCVNSLRRDGTTGPNTPTNYASQTAQVNACPCPPDIAPPGGNGTVNIDDLLAVINSWGATSGASDINHDHIVNIDDLLAVINGWGACH